MAKIPICDKLIDPNAAKVGHHEASSQEKGVIDQRERGAKGHGW